MPMLGCDFAYGAMHYRILKDHGYLFAGRYVVPSIPQKSLTLPEISQAMSEGVALVLIYETTGTTWRGGRAAGEYDMRQAASFCESLHLPADSVIYHAIDESTALPEAELIQEWISGLKAGAGNYLTGVYGGYETCVIAHDYDPTIYLYQAAGWRDGTTHPYADIIQSGTSIVDDIQIDIDTAMRTEFGQVKPPVQAQPVEETDLPFYTSSIEPGIQMNVPIVNGTINRIGLYCDIGLHGDEHQAVRVAFWSATKGYSQIETVTLSDAKPHWVLTEEADVEAISFDRGTSDGSAPIGYFATK